MPEIEIRPLRPGDEPDWRRLWTGYLEFYQTSVPEEVYVSSFARLLSEDPQEFHGRIALVDGTPLGIVH
ncbi:MAG: GNAT family N-acetyltransferase, partial [Paracoccaceae bacterium]